MAERCETCDALRSVVESQQKLIDSLVASRPISVQPRPYVAPNVTYPTGTWPPAYDTSGCPCRQENGGSGVCGCVLGGMQVTC